MHAGTQSKQFASTIDRTGNINFTENRTGKSFFFSQDSKETCSLIFVSVIRKGISGKCSIRENNTHVFFLRSVLS